MNQSLLVLWFALIAADRIDLLAGKSGILLLPNLVLPAMVIAVELLRITRSGGRFHAPRNAGAYALVASAFLAVVLVSVFYAFEIGISAKRYVLLAYQIYTTLLVAVVLAQRARPAELLVRGAFWGIGIGTVFNGLQLWSYLQRGSGEWALLGGMVDMRSGTYGPWLPRLSAMVLDPNRGGMVLLAYAFILLSFAPRSKKRTLFVSLAVLGMVVTLSRSVLLAGMITMGIAFLRRRGVQVTPRRVIGAAAALGVLAALFLASPRTMAAVGDALSPVMNRFSHREGSSQVHYGLMERAVELATRNTKTALVGVGYGNSYAFLTDFFGDSEYGNLHSLYLQVWVESGGFALLLYLVLLGMAVARGGAYQPLLAGIAAFNLFYALGAEPLMWFLLALAWTRVGDPAAVRLPAPAAPVRAPPPPARVPLPAA